MHIIQIGKVFKSFANRRRLAIMKLLSRHKEMPVADIAGHIRLSFTSTSKHLNLLKNADVLDRRQEGLTVYYRIASALPDELRRFVSIVSNSRE